MELTDQKIAEQLLEILGGNDNILGVSSCMTRMHFRLNNKEEVDFEKLEKLDSVLGTVDGDEFQVIFGPAKSTRVNEEFIKLINDKTKED